MKMSDFVVPIIAQYSEDVHLRRRFVGCATIFGDGIFLSCKHIFDEHPGASFYALDVETKTEYPIGSIAKDAVYDMAVFACKDLWLRSPVVSFEPQWAGVDIFSIGFIGIGITETRDPHLSRLIHKGYIVSAEGPAFEFGGIKISPSRHRLSYIAVQGMSGGPVINLNTGHLIGVLYGNEQSNIGQYSTYEESSDGSSHSEQIWRIHEYGLMHSLKDFASFYPDIAQYT